MLNKSLKISTFVSAFVILAVTRAVPAYAQSWQKPTYGPAPILTIDAFRDPKAHPSQDLTEIPLEELMNIDVTSVSKKTQKLSLAPAAIAVISSEDIRRSGMNSIPELLRIAPGVHVAQVSSSQWAIGTRGTNSLLNNNLLVLMDGRTLYTPVFSGVQWDTVDTILADIDRIEVIRGPGATLWGSNAVNGVINITTKNAQDTQGLYLQDYTGTDGCIGSVRYGGNIDNRVFYRLYAKYRAMDNFKLDNGENPADGWDYQHTGFRVDAHLTSQDLLTVQGDIFTGRFGKRYPEGVFFVGGEKKTNAGLDFEVGVGVVLEFGAENEVESIRDD
jgi:iron complex outermembrane recepter protein